MHFFANTVRQSTPHSTAASQTSTNLPGRGGNNSAFLVLILPMRSSIISIQKQRAIGYPTDKYAACSSNYRVISTLVRTYAPVVLPLHSRFYPGAATEHETRDNVSLQPRFPPDSDSCVLSLIKSLLDQSRAIQWHHPASLFAVP